VSGASFAQAARDLDLHENMPRRWAKEMPADPANALLGQGLRAERDILKKAAGFFAREAK
jgi:transposase